ncbi:MAG TPA: shikimate dehydrogenase [Chitinophagaceae bacterium]
MRLFGLIGYPLAQSFSKKYFDEKFESEGLTDCRFQNFSIASIEEFPKLLNANPDLQGMAVTIPYKQAVLKYLDSTVDIPAGLQACNCIRIKEGKLSGHNTDHIGFEKSLLPLLKPYHQKALVLGNGGATEAVIYSLKRLNIGYSIVSRKIHKGSSLTYADVNENIIEEHTLIINTTPLGMYPKMDEAPEIPYQFISNRHLLYDLVYNPEKTLFLQKGEERDASIKNGFEMLVLQAEENWQVWND